MSTSGGVAIVARKHRGLVHFEVDKVRAPPLVPARRVAAKLSAPGLGTIAVYSGYLHCGVGMSVDNKDIIAEIRTHVQEHKLSWLCGADWDMPPEKLAASGVLKMLGAKITTVLEPTCISPQCARTLDYFVSDEALAAALGSPEVVQNAATKPHKPTQVRIAAGLAGARVPNSGRTRGCPPSRSLALADAPLTTRKPPNTPKKRQWRSPKGTSTQASSITAGPSPAGQDKLRRTWRLPRTR